MKAVVTVLLASLAGVAVAGSQQAKEDTKPAARGKASITGVKGMVFRINGNKNPDAKVSCQAHDLIEIDWTYPIAPPFPTKAIPTSSDPTVVKDTGTHTVYNVGGPLGTGTLGAFFKAEKKGNANLTFTITRGTTEVVVRCAVEVK
jgi:hypothetical protein